MKLSTELKKRGFINQSSTENLSDLLDGIKRTVYLGIDPTADSMHVGHLVPYMMLNHMMQAGHNVIVLMGGATALIGDPSFRDKERDIATVEEIKKQCEGLEDSIRKITVSDEVMFFNNYEWLSKLSAIEFLREVGKHFTVNSMIKKESVARRFEEEEGISYTEFSYSLLQGYDFYYLNTSMDCTLQIGGSDQWGNMIAGVDFVRRKTGKEVYALTMPLVVDKTTGKKFGKSEGNAVWLDAEKTSPYEFYQFWINVSDESVIDYLKLFTFLPLEEIEKIENTFASDKGSRSAQKILALEVTSFVHGKEVAIKVAKASQVVFGEISLTDLAPEELTLLKENLQSFKVKDTSLIIDVLVETKLAVSKREARTFIESGAVHVGENKVTGLEAVLGRGEYGDLVLIKRGKKNFVIVEVV